MFGEGTPTELQIILVLAVIKYIKHAKGYNLLKNGPFYLTEKGKMLKTEHLEFYLLGYFHDNFVN